MIVVLVAIVQAIDYYLQVVATPVVAPMYYFEELH
jgi:hypothetical protein